MILISGEALIDLIPDPVKANAYDAVLGGSPFNVAIGLARLGSATAFVSRVSADGNGEALVAALAENGVHLGFVARDKRPSKYPVPAPMSATFLPVLIPRMSITRLICRRWSRPGESKIDKSPV